MVPMVPMVLEQYHVVSTLVLEYVRAIFWYVPSTTRDARTNGIRVYQVWHTNGS
jgi:hypothetical protein